MAADRESQEGLRVLLVAEQASLRDDFEAALRASSGAELFWVSQPGAAVPRAESLIPSLIVVDDAIAPDGALPLVRDLSQRVPEAAILYLVDGGRVALASQAVLAGARTFLLKPFDREGLLATLGQLSQARRATAEPVAATARGRAIAFCAPRGGTGRTTLAINTAVGLHAASEQRVLLLDADFGAPAVDVFLNLHPEHDLREIVPRLGQLDRELLDMLVSKHASGIHALTAPPPLSTMGAPITVAQAEQLMTALRRSYPWVLVDVGMPLDATSFSFLDSADRIIVTVVPEMVALRNARWLMEQFAAHGYRQDKVWIAVTRSTIPGAIAPEEIERRLGVSVRYTIPDDPALVMHSLNRGVPVVSSHARGALVRAFQGVAQDLIATLRPTGGTGPGDSSDRVRRSSLFGLPGMR